MLRQTAENIARVLLTGCERAKGREVHVMGPQAADVYRRALEINPELDFTEEIARLDAGGNCVAVFSDSVAEVCRIVVDAAELAGSAGAGEDAAAKQAEAVAKGR